MRPIMTNLDHDYSAINDLKNNESENANEKSCFVAVHLGAGSHSEKRTPIYRELCEKICLQVIKYLHRGHNAREAVAYAITLLEDSPLTNAGLGSNLTLDEKVECDASIMDSNGFGSVGAVSNIKNPILIALSLLESQIKGTLSMGRIVPCMLVGDGARIWAREHDISEVDDNDLKTALKIPTTQQEIMIKSHQHFKEKLIKIENSKNTTKEDAISSKQELVNNIETFNEKKLDTVGAIVVDSYGKIASAVSSGGIILKHPGRVGHASFYGCGCWVEEEEYDEANETKHSVGICTTGTGEFIIKTLFAKECAEHILNHKEDINFDLVQFYKKKFFNSSKLKNYSDKYVGAMVCKLEETNKKKSLDLVVSHSTPSMCFGYISSNMNKPISHMSRLNEANNSNNEPVLITNIHLNLDSHTKMKLNNDEDYFTITNKKKQRKS